MQRLLPSAVLPSLALLVLAACASTPDVEPAAPPPGFEIIVLEIAQAEDVANAVRALIADAAAGTSAENAPQIQVDPRTNSVLVMAPEARMAEIKTLIVALDQ